MSVNMFCTQNAKVLDEFHRASVEFINNHPEYRKSFFITRLSVSLLKKDLNTEAEEIMTEYSYDVNEFACSDDTGLYTDIFGKECEDAVFKHKSEELLKKIIEPSISLIKKNPDLYFRKVSSKYIAFVTFEVTFMNGKNTGMAIDASTIDCVFHYSKHPEYRNFYKLDTQRLNKAA